MGYLSNGSCFTTAPAAADAACSAFPRSSVDGGETVVVSCVGVGTDGSALQLQRVSATTTTSETRVVAFAPCDPVAEYADLSQLWLIGLGAAAGVFALKQFVYRLVTNQ
jgi:hypothetical protein